MTLLHWEVLRVTVSLSLGGDVMNLVLVCYADIVDEGQHLNILNPNAMQRARLVKRKLEKLRGRASVPCSKNI